MRPTGEDGVLFVATVVAVVVFVVLFVVVSVLGGPQLLDAGDAAQSVSSAPGP